MSNTDIRRSSDEQQATPRLTPTEIALLENMSTGKTNQQLAEAHGISINTVKFHLHNIFEKLKVRNRKQAVQRYQELNGLPEPD